MSVVAVAHLNTCSFRVVAARLVRSRAQLLAGRTDCVTHCLLVETDRHGLVLVDPGLGTREASDPATVPAPVRLELRPALRRDETALARIEARGVDPREVRHVVFTHLDLDHAAALSDFPWATAHVMHDELRHAGTANTLTARLRYARRPLRQHRRWRVHEPGGDDLYGLTGVRFLPELGDDFALVPLPGHTRAHCGVALRRGSGWLLHAGDAYMDRDEIELGAAPGLHQLMVEADRRGRSATVDALRRLRREHGGDVEMFCSHDRAEFERLASA